MVIPFLENTKQLFSRGKLQFFCTFFLFHTGILEGIKTNWFEKVIINIAYQNLTLLWQLCSKTSLKDTLFNSTDKVYPEAHLDPC